MQVWLVYRNYYENHEQFAPQSMSEAGLKWNIQCKVFFEDYFSIIITKNGVDLYYKGQKLDALPDAVFFRCYNFDVMDYFEQHNIPIVNSAQGMRLCKDKYQTHIIASTLNILQPKTIRAKSCDYHFIATELGSPFVLKENTGRKGENVFLISNEEQFLNVKSKLSDFICQKYVRQSSGHDIRLYVIGEKVIGAVERVAENNDFRSNVCLGAMARDIVVPDSVKQTALQLAHTMQLSVCSVDFLISDGQYYLCEVNGSAALSSFINLGYNMQQLIMEYISKIH